MEPTARQGAMVHRSLPVRAGFAACTRRVGIVNFLFRGRARTAPACYADSAERPSRGRPTLSSARPEDTCHRGEMLCSSRDLRGCGGNTPALVRGAVKSAGPPPRFKAAHRLGRTQERVCGGSRAPAGWREGPKEGTGSPRGGGPCPAPIAERQSGRRGPGEMDPRHRTGCGQRARAPVKERACQKDVQRSLPGI